MRLLVALAAVIVLVVGACVVASRVFRPPPAAERLAGVSVAVTGFTIEDLAGHAHRLHLAVLIRSTGDLDQCLGFTLDEPFANRRLADPAGGCVRPRSGSQAAVLTFEHLTDDDLLFPSHTLVWGIPGGRCGPIFELFGVCVVDMAGTASVELPSRSTLPTFGPIGSFIPLFSFPPP